jgi:hypothetical protein
MSRRTHSSILCCLLALSACGRETAASADPLAGLALDRGKRWPADEHTRQSMRSMLDATRRGAEKRDAAATKALGVELGALLDRLFAGCTMQGPAHAALHVYLTALMPRVEAMRGEDAAAASRARDEAAAILDRFTAYFE